MCRDVWYMRVMICMLCCMLAVTVMCTLQQMFSCSCVGCHQNCSNIYELKTSLKQIDYLGRIHKSVILFIVRGKLHEMKSKKVTHLGKPMSFPIVDNYTFITNTTLTKEKRLTQDRVVVGQSTIYFPIERIRNIERKDV